MQKELALLARIEPKPEHLVRGLQLLQARFGVIGDEGVKAAAQYFTRQESDVEGIIAFYPQFTRDQGGRILIEVCRGRACGKKGASGLLQGMPENSNGRFMVKTVDCLCVCAQAPAVRVNGKLHTRMNREKMKKLLLSLEKTE